MDLSNSPGYIEAVASSRKKTKENLRVEQVIPSEILEDSGESGIKVLLEKYYEFMNSHEFIYNEEEAHGDLILDGLARFRIKDEKGENNQFYTDETGNLSKLVISASDEFLPRASTFVGSSSIVDETLYTITLTQTQQEGMPIGALVEYFATGAPLGGLQHHGYYYIVYSYKNQIKLSSEPNGDPIGISLSGVPSDSTHKLVGVNRSMEVDIDLRNITISNGNDLPGSLRASESDIGKTFTVNGLEAFNGLQAELTTPITNWVGPGPSYVLNSIEDAMDIDKNSDSEIDSTNQYLEMMQKEIAAAIPRSVSNVNVNKNTLYKRIVDFYKIRGSSDSVETFFRLLFNEPVEIVKPYDSTLIPSTSDYDEGTGLFATTRGFVSDKKIRLHDSYKYQKYSYLIKTGKNITDWDNVFNRLVHPAGFIFFGEILLLLENTRAALGDHKDSGAKDVTRESTFRDPALGFRRAQQQIRAYGTYNTINKDFPRFTLSSMPGIQPGVIGIEDIPLLVKAFGSVYGPKPEAFRFANASLVANIDSNGTITSVDIVQKGSGYTIPPSTTLSPSSLTVSNSTTVPPGGAGGTDNQFTTSTNHGFVTGDRVNIAKDGPFNDLDVLVTYYVRRIDDDTFTLHILLEDAEAGTDEVELNSANVAAAATASTVLTFTKENLAEITIFDAAATTPATNVVAVINSNGEIESVSVGNGGAGYQNPVVTVDAPLYSNGPAETQLSHINIPYLYGKTFRQRPAVYIEPPQAKDENDVPLTTNVQATSEITLQPTGLDYVKIRNSGIGFNNINREYTLRNTPDNSTHFLDQEVRTGEQITLRIETSYIIALGQANEPSYSSVQNAEVSWIVENPSSATTAEAVVTISFANSTVGDDWLVKLRQVDGGALLTIQGTVAGTGTGEAANSPRLQFSNPDVTYTADPVFQTDFTGETIGALADGGWSVGQHQSTINTVAIEADPDDSSNTVLKVQTDNGLDTDAAGNIGGARRTLKLYEPENVIQLQSNTIKVSFKAKKSASGGANSMQAAYSTNQHGNSQWQTFTGLSATEWTDCSFEYNIADSLPSNDDYVAFQGDGINGIVYIDDIKIELKYDYPKAIVRTNTDGTLAGIKIIHSGSGYTDVPTITPTDGSHAVLEAFLVPSKIDSININNHGHGYILNPDVWIGSGMDIEKRVVDDTVKLILSLNHEEDGLNLLDGNSYFGRKGDSYYSTSKKFGFNQTISQFGDQNIDTNYINNINKLNINSYISKEDKPPE